MNTLKVTHNSGFFSCFSKRLEAIVWYFDTYKKLPDRVDSSTQFSLYKNDPAEDLIPLYFEVKHTVSIPYEKAVHFYNDMQFVNYNVLDLPKLTPFVDAYFTPSKTILERVAHYEQTYAIDYATTCAVFYRGNDKSTETSIGSHESYIAKAQEMYKENPTIRFLVQSDETEFVEAFVQEFPNSIIIKEVPSIRKQISTVSDKVPKEKRANFGVDFFAALLVVSKCNYVITHSGNCGLWVVLYRGTTKHVYQYFNGSWNPNSSDTFWQRSKRYLKVLLKKQKWWSVVRT